MRVLVVHDRDEVARRVVDVLVAGGVPAHDVVKVEDGVSARMAMQRELFDLAIIDLTLPHISGRTTPDYSIAEDLLLEVFSSDSLNVPGDLVGLTQDTSAFEAVRTEIGSHLMAVIREDETGFWREQILDKVKYVMRASESRIVCASRYYDYDVAIITALDSEFSPYSEIFELTDLKDPRGLKSFIFEDQGGIVRRGVGCAIGRVGQASAASMTQSILARFRPMICFMSGFCGGFSEKVELGDVIIAENVFDWDCGKWKGVADAATFVPRPEPINIRDKRIHSVARLLLNDGLSDHDSIVGQIVAKSKGRIKQVSLRMGPMASGSSVIADSTLIPRIQGLNESILGADMEAYGFYYSANHTFVARPDFLVIKAVADFCDRLKDDANQEACSFLSAKVVEEIIRRYCSF